MNIKTAIKILIVAQKLNKAAGGLYKKATGQGDDNPENSVWDQLNEKIKKAAEKVSPEEMKKEVEQIADWVEDHADDAREMMQDNASRLADMMLRSADVIAGLMIDNADELADMMIENAEKIAKKAEAKETVYEAKPEKSEQLGDMMKSVVQEAQKKAKEGMDKIKDFKQSQNIEEKAEGWLKDNFKAKDIEQKVEKKVEQAKKFFRNFPKPD